LPRNTRSSSTPETGQKGHSQTAEATNELLDSIQRLVPGKTRQFDEQEVVYREGQVAASVFAILSGMVKLLAHLPNGKVRIVRLEVAGDWLALHEGLGENQTYEYEAIAVTKVEVAQFNAANLRALEAEDSDRYTALLKHGYDCQEKANKWIVDFSTGSVKVRLAHLLGFLGEIDADGNDDIVNLLTVSEIADVLGVTPESASRFLAKFKRKKVLTQVNQDENDLYRIDQNMLDKEKKD
jgi:CRP/FNR family transcriptional regulator, anaerobic regulatory protein